MQIKLLHQSRACTCAYITAMQTMAMHTYAAVLGEEDFKCACTIFCVELFLSMQIKKKSMVHDAPMHVHSNLRYVCIIYANL